MATGLVPDSHGVTDNTLFDPLLGRNLSGFADDPEFWNYHPEVLPFYVRISKLFSIFFVFLANE
jgi:predicted AlkP superfamily pyrophosphatase or phosphodiesterase